MKVHIHEDQLDGKLYAWCGRGSLVEMPHVFEATPVEKRCKLCDREWFPHGQPEWHFEQAVKDLLTAGVAA